MTTSDLGSDPGTDTVGDRRLDGNAAAGPLAELFGVDLAAAVVICDGCGRQGPLAANDLYADAPALVLRCPGCTAVVLRFAASGGVLRLDMRGTRLLTVTAPGG